MFSDSKFENIDKISYCFSN